MTIEVTSSGKWLCPNCHLSNRSDRSTCWHCGEDFSEQLPGIPKQSTEEKTGEDTSEKWPQDMQCKLLLDAHYKVLQDMEQLPSRVETQPAYYVPFPAAVTFTMAALSYPPTQDIWNTWAWTLVVGYVLLYGLWPIWFAFSYSLFGGLLSYVIIFAEFVGPLVGIAFMLVRTISDQGSIGTAIGTMAIWFVVGLILAAIVGRIIRARY
jgi:hypothetical protein